MNARLFQRAAVCLAMAGLLAPPKLLSAAETAGSLPAGTAASAAQVSDVALAQGGTLRGQVVDASGTSVPGIVVTVRQQNQLVAQSISDAAGKFEIAGLPGGIFQLSTPNGEGTYRLWAPATSPPNARGAALLVHDTQVVRGQSKLAKLFSHPIIIAGVIAAAVAIPVTVHAIEVNRDKSSS